MPATQKGKNPKSKAPRDVQAGTAKIRTPKIDQRSQNLGIIANYDGSTYVIDPETNGVSGPYFADQSGINGVVITPDGMTGIISRERTKSLLFVDLSDAHSPAPLGTTSLPANPRSMIISPDGTYALVNCEGRSTISVHVPSRTFIQKYDNLSVMAIAADGTVLSGEYDLTSDYKLHVLRLDSLTGKLSYGYRLSTDRSWIYFLCISPDGRSAIGIGEGPDISVIVLRVDPPGNATVTGYVPFPKPVVGSYKSWFGTFSPNGRKAYVVANDAYEGGFSDIVKKTDVRIYDVLGPGAISDSGISISIPPYGGNLAVESKGRYGYIAVGRSGSSITVIDLNANTLIGSFALSGLYAVPGQIAFPVQALLPDFSDSQFNYETADRISVRSDQTVTFTIYYKNLGGNATGVIIKTILSSSLEGGQALDGGTVSGQTITWDLGNVAVSGGGSARFTVRVKKGIPAGTKIFNFASIDSDKTSPVDTKPVALTVVY